MGRHGSKEEAETPREGLACQPHTRESDSARHATVSKQTQKEPRVAAP